MTADAGFDVRAQVRTTCRLLGIFWVVVVVALVLAGIGWGFPSGWSRVAFAVVPVLASVIVFWLGLSRASRPLKAQWNALDPTDAKRILAAGWDPVRLAGLPSRSRIVAVTRVRHQILLLSAYAGWASWAVGALLVVDLVRVVLDDGSWAALREPMTPFVLLPTMVIALVLRRRGRAVLDRLGALPKAQAP